MLGGMDYCFQKHKINNVITEHGIMKVLKEIILTSIFKA